MARHILPACIMSLVALVAAAAIDHAGPQRCSNVAAMSFAGQPAIYRKCHGATFGLTGRATFVRYANGESI